jgi:hypothetical protein
MYRGDQMHPKKVKIKKALMKAKIWLRVLFVLLFNILGAVCHLGIFKFLKSEKKS